MRKSLYKGHGIKLKYEKMESAKYNCNYKCKL